MKDSVKQGWVEKPLGEISTLQRGFDLPKKLREPGEFPLVTSSGPTDTHSEAKVKGPGVATGRSGSIGNVFFVEEDFWPLNTALYVKDFHGNDPRFVYHLLNYVDLGRFASGAGVPTLNRNDVHGELYRIPTDIEEQQRIVAVLDEAFEGLARARVHAEANLQNARELFGSALQAALQDETVSWNDVELADLGDVVTGSTPKTSDKGNLGDHLPFIKPGDFLPDGSLVYDNQGLSEQGAAVSRVLPGGSALMVCIGATIGKAGCSDRPIATNQQINAVVPKDGVSGEYLYYQMLTPEFQADVMRQAGQATLPIINKGKWSKLRVRMPSDLTKQAAIVDKLSSIRAQVDAVSTRYEAQIFDLDDLRQSLLQKAFAGELT